MGVVLAPVNGKGTALRLAQAGARELYMGFYDPAWTKEFGDQAALNRMSGFGQEANGLSFDQLIAEIGETLASCTQLGLEKPRLFCVFNAASYTAKQVAYISKHYLPALARAGFTGIIVSGTELIESVHANGLTAVASTMCAIYNEDLARYYQKAGIDRAILPRDVTLDDIAAVMRAVPELNFEVFFMRNGCIFADSHCMGLHKAGCPSTCLALRESPSWNQLATWNETEPHNPWSFAENDTTYRNAFHMSACGLCALWRFEQMGVDAYKVVGRGDDVDELADDVFLVETNIRIAKTCASEEEFLERMWRPDSIRELCGAQGLNCYYPQVRFGN